MRNAMTARLITVETTTAICRYLVKGILIPGLISSIESSDADVRELAGTDAPVVVDARHINRGDDGGQDADAERHGESLDRPGAELEQDDAGEKCRHVGVDDRGTRAIGGGLHCGAHRV